MDPTLLLSLLSMLDGSGQQQQPGSKDGTPGDISQLVTTTIWKGGREIAKGVRNWGRSIRRLFGFKKKKKRRNKVIPVPVEQPVQYRQEIIQPPLYPDFEDSLFNEFGDFTVDLYNFGDSYENEI